MGESEGQDPQSPARTKLYVLYPVASLLLGLVSGASFLSGVFNVKPMWVLTGPPAIIANILVGLLGFKRFVGNPVAQAAVMALFVVYYFVLLLPAFLIRSARFEGAPTPTHFYIMQFGLLSMHTLLTVVLFILMRA